MSDHVKEALKANVVQVEGVPSPTTGELPDLSGVLIAEPLRAEDVAAFLQALIDKGPDEREMEVFWWVKRRFLSYLVSRLTAIGKGAEADV